MIRITEALLMADSPLFLRTSVSNSMAHGKGQALDKEPSWNILREGAAKAKPY
jgi:hypothetical protein